MRIFLKKEGKNRAPAPGIVNISGENARGLDHSSVQAVANSARMETFRRNSDILKSLRWLGTLDPHTCLLCGARDGKEYTLMDDPPEPVGHTLKWSGGPGAIHWGCRCMAIPITKTFKQLGVDLPEPPEAMRASVEGPIPASMTFEAWLSRRSKEQQDEQLGARRAALWRAGKITLEQLLDARGQELTLAELKAKYGC